MNSTYLNFDLWDKGLFFILDLKIVNTVTCPYYNTSFQSLMIFYSQSDDIVFDFKIINKSKNVKFIKNLYKFKIYYNEKTINITNVVIYSLVSYSDTLRYNMNICICISS